MFSQFDGPIYLANIQGAMQHLWHAIGEGKFILFICVVSPAYSGLPGKGM